jgi:hypothetical protein
MFNDDYYALLNAFPRPDSLLVTNDQFRDHIYKLSSKEHNLDLIRSWRSEKVIEYQYDTDTQQLMFYMPLPYSFRVQRHQGYYYFPCKVTETGSEWYRFDADAGS